MTHCMTSADTGCATSADALDFDAPYDDPDPWGYCISWYEARRHTLMLACLPTRRSAFALEIGCAHGEFTAMLAERADAVVATDRSEQALALARARVPAPHVRFIRSVQPASWPEGHFDLIVMADVGYYMDADALRSCAEHIAQCLAPTGTVLLAHWRHPFKQASLSQPVVHALLREELPLHALCAYEDLDLRIDVLSREPRSVAQHEGLA